MNENDGMLKRWSAPLLLRFRGLKAKWLTNASYLWRHRRIGLSTEVLLGEEGKLEIGSHSVIEGQGRITIFNRGSMVVANDFSAGRGCEFVVSENANLRIGNHVVISTFANIRCTSSITIGNHARIGHYASILGGQYNFKRKDVLIGEQGYTPKSITIGEGVWIGAGAIILPGIVVGTGAIVGAGAVVTKNVDDYVIVAGNPARIIGRRE